MKIRNILCKFLTLIMFASSTGTASVMRSASKPQNQESGRTQELTEADGLTAEIVKLYNAKKFKEALPLAEKVVEIRQRLLSGHDAALGSAYVNLGELDFELKKNSEAEKAFKQALAVYEGQARETSNGIGRVLDKLAYLRFLQGDYQTADGLYIRSLDLKQRDLGPSDPQTIAAMKNYACLSLIARSKNPEANQEEKDENKRTLRARASCWLDNSRDDCATANFSIRHQGVLNGKAIKLAQPPYPIKAQQKHLTGTVFVSVVIDENGNVTEAKAICGPMPEFEQVAVEAARASRFTPTKLNNQPVTVTGVIIYNFVAR